MNELDIFLRDYEPKSLMNILGGCLKHKKLKGYTLVSESNIRKLICGKTYLKYIKNTEGGDVTKIRSGGILLAGGILTKNGFNKNDDPKKWTHLMLKKAMHDEEDNFFTYVIKISNYHLFYKLFSSEMTNESLRKMAIDMKAEYKKK
jgi:hypothetical protein